LKRSLLGLALVIVLSAGAIGYHLFTTAATTSFSVKPQQSTTDVLGSETSLHSWQTDQFTTQIPTWLHVASSTDDRSDPLSGTYILSGGREKNGQIAISIAALGNNTLSETPAVRLRTNRPTEYTPINLAAAPDGAVTFSHSGNYETSVFWQHQGHYISVVASGSSDVQADVQTALDAILTNWQWQA
jgi:hypothetical protein